MRARRAAFALAGAAALGAVLGCGLGGCAKQREEAPAQGARPAAIGAAELKRGHDACAAYVTKVCACAEAAAAGSAGAESAESAGSAGSAGSAESAGPTMHERCALAKAMPESIEVALQVSAHPDTERLDVVQSADAIRKTIARCIELTAKLPELGCP